MKKLGSAVGILAILAVLTACGSGSHTDGPAPGGATTSSEAGAGGTSETPGDPTATNGDSDGDQAAAAGSDFCTRLLAADKKLGDISAATRTGDTEKIKQMLGEVHDTFTELGKGAPDEVQPAIEDIVEVVADGEETLAQMSDSGDIAGSALGQKLPNDLNALGNYIGNNCYN